MKNIDQYKHNVLMLAFAVIITFSSAVNCKAQLSPFQTGYFQDRYYADPAMAGIDKGLNINLNYRQEMTSFPGAPKNQALTADYYATDRVGLGLNITNDQAGLIRQTRVMATYAYHIPLNANADKLSFGLSVGFNSPSIDNGAVNGDGSDVQIADFNQVKTYVDGDFGVAYTSHNLSLEAAVPNLKTIFFKNQADVTDVDRSVFMAAARYKIYTGGAVTFEPLVVFRSVKGYDSIFDAGVSLNLADQGISLESVYHSSQSLGLGLGIGPKAFRVNLTYDMETGPVRTFSNGGFELGLKIKL